MFLNFIEVQGIACFTDLQWPIVAGVKLMFALLESGKLHSSFSLLSKLQFSFTLSNQKVCEGNTNF